MILVVGHTKGGVGKSLLAVNLAIARARQGRRKLLLVDADSQGTAMSFTQLRVQQTGRSDYTAVALTGTAIRTQVRQLAPNYAEVIIDCGGQDNGSFRAALTIANKLLVPVPPRTWEIWATEQLLPLIEEAQQINEGLRAYTVLNSADSQGQDNEQAAGLLREFEPTLTYLDTPLVRRKVWADALTLGQAVHEHKPRNEKAVAELVALVKMIYRKAGK